MISNVHQQKAMKWNKKHYVDEREKAHNIFMGFI